MQMKPTRSSGRRTSLSPFWQILVVVIGVGLAASLYAHIRTQQTSSDAGIPGAVSDPVIEFTFAPDAEPSVEPETATHARMPLGDGSAIKEVPGGSMGSEAEGPGGRESRSRVPQGESAGEPAIGGRGERANEGKSQGGWNGGTGLADGKEAETGPSQEKTKLAMDAAAETGPPRIRTKQGNDEVEAQTGGRDETRETESTNQRGNREILGKMTIGQQEQVASLESDSADKGRMGGVQVSNQDGSERGTSVAQSIDGGKEDRLAEPTNNAQRQRQAYRPLKPHHLTDEELFRSVLAMAPYVPAHPTDSEGVLGGVSAGGTRAV